MELRQDIIAVNPTTNTVTLSTESYDRPTKYLAIKSLMVNSQEHEVTSYSVPNSETCKGIIYTSTGCVLEKLSLKKIFYPGCTKKQGPLPKKNQEEQWPPLSATPSSNKSNPPQGCSNESFRKLTTVYDRAAVSGFRGPVLSLWCRA
ncbi:hypothetical protein HPB50_010906 [Hyalomma asiaticum]|uniref:Uncharacterized protein n=1 Tax=Hyalomma asiaticum TaxID=266040 RepID=A0ACB7T6S2_HYAAI|nr:hypothetical protein HPB50_010906 [Hyalomma asiaticum]